MGMLRIIQSLFLAFIIFTGCTTGPRLGFPLHTVGIPVAVTLFSTITRQGKIDKKLDWGSAEIWGMMYKEKFEGMLGRVSLDIDALQGILNDLFLKKATEAKDLFVLNPAQVFNWDIQYSASMDDGSNNSGFDFSLHKDLCASKYILALTIDEWGYVVKRVKDDDGPYISVSIRLIDCETGASLWKYTKTYQQAISNSLEHVNYGSITAEEIEKTYQGLIYQAVNQFFSRLK